MKLTNQQKRAGAVGQQAEVPLTEVLPKATGHYFCLSRKLWDRLGVMRKKLGEKYRQITAMLLGFQVSKEISPCEKLQTLYYNLS
jgi:hypothetical protein